MVYFYQMSVSFRNQVSKVKTPSTCLWLEAQKEKKVPYYSYRGWGIEEEVERQYRGTPCSLNNYYSPQKEIIQSAVLTSRQSTVRKLVLTLSKI